MSRILCVWELGSYLGHLTRFLPIALKLQEQGHEVSFVIRDLSATVSIFGKHQFKAYQAPLWSLHARGLPKPLENYAEILMQFGYLDKNGLLGMVKAWRNTFEFIKPELVLFDYAPTALIAARDLKVPRAIIGGGFFTPPDISPTPKIRPWSKVSDKRLRASEQKVVDVINGVLASLKLAPVSCLYEIFQVEENFLTTFQELDHYPDRKNATYWGPVSSDENGIKPAWANHPGKKIFAYLKPEYKGVENILQAMQQADGNSLVFSPNLPDKYIKKYQSASFQFSRKPFMMSAIIRDCDAALCHAGDTLTTVLLGGKPQLLFPMQIEQHTIAQNAEKLGAALVCNPDAKVEDISQKLAEVLNSPGYQQQAHNFADKYQRFLNFAPADSIAKRCDLLLKSNL